MTREHGHVHTCQSLVRAAEKSPIDRDVYARHCLHVEPPFIHSIALKQNSVNALAKVYPLSVALWERSDWSFV